MSTFTTVNEFNFKNEVLNSRLPILIDFGAEWCAPCKQVDPILEKLAVQWQGKIKIVKVDIDASGTLVMQMQVMSAPTLILFIEGCERVRLVGLQSADKIIDKLSPFINL
jgi:thioredoxin 1